MIILLFLGALLCGSYANALEVSLLTAQGPKVLKKWSVAEVKRILSSSQNGASQALIFDSSTQDLELNVRADIDLITLYGSKGQVVRVPRFMVWRGNLKLMVGRDGSLSSRATDNPLLLPKPFFSVDQIERIELSRASTIYPGTKLQVRTNPAATRGEKLFTQSCMACHGLQRIPHLEATLLAEKDLRNFPAKHQATGQMVLDSRALRGLLAYREALASEKNSVNSQK
jgi:hypothetical protein